MISVKCPECGKDLSDKAVMCPKCGCPIKQRQEIIKEINQEIIRKSNEKQKNKIKKRKHPIVEKCFLVMGLLVIMVGYFCFFSPMKKFERYIKRGDIKKAQELFKRDITGNKNSVDQAYVIACDALDAAIEKYNKQEEDLDYTNISKFIVENFREEDITQYTTRFEKLVKSKDNYNAGMIEKANKKYVDAINKFKFVDEEDEHYEKAKEEEQQCKSEKKKEILDKIEEQLGSAIQNSKDISNSKDIQLEINRIGFLNEDEEVLNKLNELQEMVKNYVIKSAKALGKKKKYIEACQMITMDIPADMQKLDEVKKAKEQIQNDMIKWVMKKTDEYEEKEKYTKAVEFIASYVEYDKNQKLNNKLKKLKSKEKKVIVEEFEEITKQLNITYNKSLSDEEEKLYNVTYLGYDFSDLAKKIHAYADADVWVGSDDKYVSLDVQVGCMEKREYYFEDVYPDKIRFVMNDFMVMYDLESAYSTLDIDLEEECGLTTNEIVQLIAEMSKNEKVTIEFYETDEYGDELIGSCVLESDEIRQLAVISRFYVLLNKYDYLYDSFFTSAGV